MNFYMFGWNEFPMYSALTFLCCVGPTHMEFGDAIHFFYMLYAMG